MRWKLIAVAVGVLASVVVEDLSRSSASQHCFSTKEYEHVLLLPPSGVLGILSLGYRNALADLLWVRALVYFGEESVRNLKAEHVLHYGRAITSLDPYFARVYRVFAIGFNSRVSGTDPTAVARVREALSFLEDGLRALPDDGELLWDTGATYAFTLAPMLAASDLAAHNEAKMRGIEHMQGAVLRGAGPKWAGVANASTLVRLGQTEQAIEHLQEVYAVTTDPEVRTQIEVQLARLRSFAFAEGMRHVTEQLRRDHAAEYPYLSEPLYLLVGRRLKRTLSWVPGPTASTPSEDEANANAPTVSSQ